LRDEHSIDEVAQAAGISSQSIRNWKRAIDVVSTASSARPTPVELKVIDAPVQSPACGNESATPARIMLRSGAIVEVAVQLLDVRWLMALNGSVS
jgi:transposase-like protein